MNPFIFYHTMFVLSVMLTMVYIFKWHKHYSTDFSLLFIFIPIENLGYLLLAQSHSLEAALMANKVIYLGASFLNVFLMQAIYCLCHIKIKKIFNIIFYLTSMIICTSALTVGRQHFFYKSVSFLSVNGIGTLIKQYGFMHTFYYVMIVVYLILCYGALVYSYKNKKTVSHKTISLLWLVEFVSVAGFFLGRSITSKVDFITVSNILAQIIFLIIINRVCLYDITDTGVDSLVQSGNTGFISFDRNYFFLGSNETAKRIFPELNEQTVDMPLNVKSETSRIFKSYLDDFVQDEKKNEAHYERGDKIYLINIQHLYDGNKKRGYQFFITDDTADQKYIQLMDKYNATLRDTFGKIVAPQVRDYILDNKVKLGGETKRVTVLFCDIRSFTSMSEKLESTEVVKMLNIYFTAMEKCISAHKGIINKYIGDCIMAIFGAPVENENHAADAFLAAMEMREELKNVNAHLKEKGLPQIRQGIGLHTGPVTAGNIGAADRMEYTVIGDTVNVASRIQGLCKECKKDFLMSEAAVKEMEGTYAAGVKKPKFLCESAIRGKEQKIRLYRV